MLALTETAICDYFLQSVSLPRRTTLNFVPLLSYFPEQQLRISSFDVYSEKKSHISVKKSLLIINLQRSLIKALNMFAAVFDTIKCD
jgi:hypothetical protein